MPLIRPRARLAGALLCALSWGPGLLPAAAQSADQPARPRADAPVNITLPETATKYYRFETMEVLSEDGQRHYRVYVGVPVQPAPPTGYPVIYLLDGNAVMADISPDMLADLQTLSPPVLVAIGYDTPGRHDVMARAYDYTPPVNAGDAASEAPVVRGRRGGGADVFHALIEHKIKPAVQARAHIDTTRQTLWGHSYGGLFVLHTLFTHPESYQRYVAGDPSIWWGDGVILQEANAFDAKRASSAVVRIYAGDARRSSSTPRARGPYAPEKMPPPNAGPDAVQRLKAAGLDITMTVMEGQSHGAMFRQSLVPGLELAATP